MVEGVHCIYPVRRAKHLVFLHTPVSGFGVEGVLSLVHGVVLLAQNKASCGFAFLFLLHG